MLAARRGALLSICMGILFHALQLPGRGFREACAVRREVRCAEKTPAEAAAGAMTMPGSRYLRPTCGTSRALLEWLEASGIVKVDAGGI
jgi:hypothetical protein